MLKRIFSRMSVGLIVTNAVRLVLILGFISAFFRGRDLAMAFCIFAFVSTFTPRLLNKFGIKTGSEVQITIILVIYGALFLGEVRGAFANLWWWDILLKTIATIALSFIGLTVVLVLEEHEHLNSSPFMVVTLAFALSFTLGAIWEVLEFSLDNIFGFGLQQIGTGVVAIDLIITGASALFVSSLGYIYKKKGLINPMSGLIVGLMRKNPKLLNSEKKYDDEKIKSLISSGEGVKLEFKSSLRTNLHTNSTDKNIENSILKTIVAYLNTDGGTLIVGVNDNGDILGLDKDAFVSDDKLKLHLNNMIKNAIGPHFMHFVNYELFEIESKKILKIECISSNKRVFLKDNGVEEFYIRNGPSTIKLNGNSLIDYINNRFD
ncbi:ATP-binding protein [Candidatus Pacearchaeota archaeon]|nr:ATP-binding protein [Candidatus Pacearchaeota archaeon]